MNGPTEDLMLYLPAIPSQGAVGATRLFLGKRAISPAGSDRGSEYLSFSSSRVCELEIQRITCRLVPANERVPFQCTLFLRQLRWRINRGPCTAWVEVQGRKTQHAHAKVRKNLFLLAADGGAMYFLLADAQDLPPPPHAPRPRRSECKGDSRMSG